MNARFVISLLVSTTCFGIAWAINEHILALFTLPDNAQVSWLVRFVSAIGIYTFLFELLARASLLFTQKWWANEAHLAGEWYQIFHISNYDEQFDDNLSVRHGPVSISFDGTDLEISAENYKFDTTLAPSSWHSNKVSLHGQQLWLLFSSDGPGRGSTRGNMLFQFRGRSPNKMTGYFSDSSPATHFGTIELFRSKAEYEGRLAEKNKWTG